MGDRTLLRELKRWAIEEFNLPTQSLPNDNYFKTCVTSFINVQFNVHAPFFGLVELFLFVLVAILTTVFHIGSCRLIKTICPNIELTQVTLSILMFVLIQVMCWPRCLYMEICHTTYFQSEVGMQTGFYNLISYTS